MEKHEISIERISYPMPCSIVGAKVNGKPNFLTVAWFSMVNFKPPYLGIALNTIHYTNPGIKESGTFSVNIPSSDMAEITDYCSIVSGRKYDKAKSFEIFYGKLKTAPMIQECPYNLECKLIQTVKLVSNELYIGEIVAAYSDERYLTNGIPDMKKVNPIVLSMPDTKYFKVGEYLGQAWEIGEKLISKKD